MFSKYSNNITDDFDTSGFASDPRTKVPITHILSEFQESGGSNLMNVDGSVTPVIFTAGPPPGEVWYLESLSYYVQDKGSFSIFTFAALGIELVNGVLFSQTRNSVKTDVATYKTTGNLIFFHKDNNVLFTDSAFVGNESAVYGNRSFANPDRYILDGDNSDILSIDINDDLTGLVAYTHEAVFIKEIA